MGEEALDERGAEAGHQIGEDGSEACEEAGAESCSALDDQSHMVHDGVRMIYVYILYILDSPPTVPYRLPKRMLTRMEPGTEKACLKTKRADRTAETWNPSNRPFLE